MKATTPLSQAYGKFRAVFGATVLFSFFSNILMFVGPLYMLQVYDRVLASRNEFTLVMISGIAVALLVAYGLLEFIRSKLLVRAGLQFDDMLANPAFNRVIRHQLASPNSGAHATLQDIDRVREFMTGQGILAFFDAPWVPLFLALCFAFHPWLGMVATVGALIIFALALANEFATRGLLAEAGNANAGASHFVNTTVQNAEVIRALGMEKQLTNRWVAQHDDVLDKQAKASGRAGAIMASTKFVRMSLQIAILGMGAYLAILQEISPGIMIAASIVMGRALAPVEQAVGQWKQFVAARQAHKRLTNIFGSLNDEEDRMQLPDPKGNLSVQGLVATAPGAKAGASGAKPALLKGITFSVNQGEVLAVIGPSGSGKSTLVRHLVGAAQPAGGSVRLDGTELHHWDAEQLGRHMGYMPQDVKLFRGSVAENISRFIPDAGDAEVTAAAQLSGAYDMIQTLAEGYDTDVGDGGQSLSGGQRQRVGLARAVFRMPNLVVLDEPNSNLDAQGEQALAACIQELKKQGKTVVLVTHKANLLALTDKTLMLVGGSVEKFGPTREMFAQQAQAQQQLQAQKEQQEKAAAPAAPAVVSMSDKPRA
ncbi:type I secretion system permease/ATPase [Sulfitobacter geojensis]|uniref:Type I secretion system permease/ATPase n=3 Tax=Sulfitobacter geojensis TaxID=1342299 RepID=A0AAE2W1Q1_9RHOB|nr:type I secretion system permease/ATPase [Sulfitobacter geojensis]MBM1691572.1 type I secretion system permease/ATPase [Sulfitobacter geojensis]MBM1695622.1 type I secretion system permease/ATPase [Sulfitobacter geojensis]MBM1707800.1 type I secretion system permease/ATPase [Sulfitobacter geojensis]MBM1711861.1 type I secretion system permease/ATPase [Sulfitobacter geojensis]MBM1715915.1 type I secretion system permease/ATPase [Sulfitobacter geojensis]